jgi:hypothetical protein
MHVAPFKAARHAARVRLVWRFVRSQVGQAITPLAALAGVPFSSALRKTLLRVHKSILCNFVPLSS